MLYFLICCVKHQETSTQKSKVLINEGVCDLVQNFET